MKHSSVTASIRGTSSKSRSRSPGARETVMCFVLKHRFLAKCTTRFSFISQCSRTLYPFRSWFSTRNRKMLIGALLSNLFGCLPSLKKSLGVKNRCIQETNTVVFSQLIFIYFEALNRNCNFASSKKERFKWIKKQNGNFWKWPIKLQVCNYGRGFDQLIIYLHFWVMNTILNSFTSKNLSYLKKFKNKIATSKNGLYDIYTRILYICLFIKIKMILFYLLYPTYFHF